MVVRRFVGRAIGEAADVKPVDFASYPEYIETDTGFIYLSNPTENAYLLHRGAIRNEKLENKEVDLEYNTMEELIEDSPFAQGNEAKGGIVPAVTPQASFYGMLEGSQTFSPRRILQDPTNKTLVEFYGGSQSKAGFTTQRQVAVREHGYSLKAEIKSTHKRVLLGFSASNAFPTYSNVFDIADIGAAIGFTTNTSKYCVFTNDGAGVAATPIPFTIDKDTELHTYEIILNPTNVVFKLDGETITRNTQIPPLTTQLYVSAYGIE